MFLQSEDHDINDFLSAVNFIAPQGFNLKYFIVPYAANSSVLAGNAINNGLIYILAYVFISLYPQLFDLFSKIKF